MDRRDRARPAQQRETEKANPMNEISEPSGFQIPCRHLRNKEMYYQAAEDDEFASGIHWCGKTHESFGPDGEPVSKKDCCEGRACYLR